MSFVLDLLYPRSCLSCGEWGIYVCEKCRNRIEYVEKDACFYCNRVSLFGLTHESCKRPQGIDGLLAAAYYTQVMKDLISAIKYDFVFSSMKEMFWGLNPLVMAKFRGHARLYPQSQIVPLPLHRQRQNWRGFNQAELLAKEFQQVTKQPVKQLLIRRKKTRTQVNSQQRLHRILNIHNAFSLAKETIVEGQTITLVDDVVTTGSTIREAVRILKENKAQAVFVYCLARD